MTVSRVMQGVSSFGFAAAAAGGVTAAAITLAVASVVCLVGAAVVHSLRTMPEMLRNRTLWAVSVVGAVSLILGAGEVHVRSAPHSLLVVAGAG